MLVIRSRHAAKASNRTASCMDLHVKHSDVAGKGEEDLYGYGWKILDA